MKTFLFSWSSVVLSRGCSPTYPLKNAPQNKASSLNSNSLQALFPTVIVCAAKLIENFNWNVAQNACQFILIIARIIQKNGKTKNERGFIKWHFANQNQTDKKRVTIIS